MKETLDVMGLAHRIGPNDPSPPCQESLALRGSALSSWPGQNPHFVRPREADRDSAQGMDLNNPLLCISENLALERPQRTIMVGQNYQFVRPPQPPIIQKTLRWEVLQNPHSVRPRIGKPREIHHKL